MKTLKQILEASNHLPNMPVGSSDVEDGPHAHHGRGKAEGEINWKKKHTDNVLELDHPTGKENMDTLNARNMKKDKSKIAGLDKDAEKVAYEGFNVEQDLIEQLLDIAEVDAEQPLHLNDDSEVVLTPELAEQLVYTIDCLSEENRTKFIEALLESEDGFISMVEFANGVE